MKLKHACLALALVGCGSTPVEPATTASPTVTPVIAEEATADEATADEATADEARIAAESFVRAQGYADTAPSVAADAIVHEGIEGTLEDRRNMLDPHAVSVSPTADGWTAVFRYQDPQYAGRGRMLRSSAEGTHFVHQDLLLHAE